MIYRAAAVVVAVASLLCFPAGAPAEQSVGIKAHFAPYRLGAPTAVTLAFRIARVGGGLPSPVTAVAFSYPRRLGLARSELGLAACDPRKLRLEGPKRCPPNSIMGHGEALAELAVGPAIAEERASVVVAAGPSPDGYLHLMISATGSYPVTARVVMPTLLTPGRLRISVPLVAGIPEGPDVAVVAVRLTIGGRLTYYERRGGRRVRYRPKGIFLPPRCPRGGFHFGARVSFQDGTAARARTRVQCPSGSRRSGVHSSRHGAIG